MNHTSSETPRWVVLTPEQRDHLEQDVTVRGRRGAVLVEGPVDHVSVHGEVTIGHGRDGVVVTGPVEVREQEAPKPDPVDPILRPGDRVRLVDFDGREFHCTIRPAASQDSAAAGPWSDDEPVRVHGEGSGVREAVSGAAGLPDPQRLVSVRHDDLLRTYSTALAWAGKHLKPEIEGRIAAVLRGETR